MIIVVVDVRGGRQLIVVVAVCVDSGDCGSGGGKTLRGSDGDAAITVAADTILHLRH